MSHSRRPEGYLRAKVYSDSSSSSRQLSKPCFKWLGKTLLPKQHQSTAKIHRFIEKYNDLVFIRYEDFCRDTKRTVKLMCNILALQYNENFLKEFGNQKLTGQSGRTGNKIIEERSRREVPDNIKSSLKSSEAYSRLTKRLGY